jgi:hypothetical protein
MSQNNPTFLGIGYYKKMTTLLYDYVSFVLFLVFIGICVIVGKPLYFVDQKLRTRMVERLIRLFEFFAR